MSDLSDAVGRLTDSVAEVTDRVNEDVAHLQDLLDQALQMAADAAANDAADAAAIADLTTQRDALSADAADTVSRINAATDGLTAIDPLADFPPPEPEPTP